MWLKVIGFSALALVGTAGAGFSYLYYRGPATAPPLDIVVEPTPERLKRGEYLFTTVADCEGCHSERDFSRFNGPVIAGRRGVGTALPLTEIPGKLWSANITPDKETGLGNWTDGEKIRAIREGVSKDGRALFPVMPYQNFRYMSDEDVYSLVAYMNTLPPVKNAVPKPEIDFPVSMLIKSAPRPAGSVAAVNRGDKLPYGQYLVTMAGCAECHTPFEKGSPVAGMEFAGGHVFEMHGGPKVLSANITSDKATGIGSWDLARFQERLAAYREYDRNGAPQVGPERFTLMPWLNFSRLTDDDVEAIWEYIRRRPAISNMVNTHPGTPADISRR